MTPLQQAEVKLSEQRIRLAELAAENELTDEHRAELDALRREYTDTERRAAALRIAEPAPIPVESRNDSEGREFRELLSNADFGRYVAAAMSRQGIGDGPELELNQHLGLAANYFPMRMLAGPEPEHRAAIDGDAGAMQGTWLDRVFEGTAAERVGISFRPVAPGIAAYPVTSAGGAPQQRGRTQAADVRTYTVAVTEMKPSRRAVHGVYSIEDDMRLPGLADAITRDMRAAMTESVDLTVFKGDAGANEAGADIAGMQTAIPAAGEFTITQANKVKGDETLKAFLALVDGQYAAMMSDVMVVASVGSNVLWGGTVLPSPVTTGRTIAQFLMESGMTWATRGGIDTATAAGDFGAYVGLARGIEGAGIAAVWEQGQLIRDEYTGAKSGEVQLTLNYLWQLAFPRSDSFRRMKFVS